MDNREFKEKLMDIVRNYKTLYVMGCFGAPLNEINKERYKKNDSYNKTLARQQKIDNATSDTFGFDCVNLIKGVLWGWCGDKTKTYGGAIYASNGVSDINADSLIKKCYDVKTEFDELEISELLWMPGHVGIYIGKGLAIECSPAWHNKVQITTVANMRRGESSRMWKRHGKLPYIKYLETENNLKSNKEIAKEVILGAWGNGTKRKEKLIKAGYDYINIQKEVNKILKGDDKNV